ncbi:MAG: tetratricopeptide repeat protein, partial [Deltaproteobacteria bacterium]|nr:tetratricopeptide repeat protein [Deltaproteobacteria bacterium]
RIDGFSNFKSLLKGSGIGYLLREKIVLFMFSAASSIVTYQVQQAGGAVSSVDVLSVKVRLANAIVSYVAYIGKMIWPHRLAVLYPHTRAVHGWQVTGAALCLVVIFILVIAASRRHPYLVVGWLWYLGTLFPVIGIVQVGVQAMADRYAYVPMIGLFMIIAWGTSHIIAQRKYASSAVFTFSGILMVILMITSRSQLSYWSDSLTLFKHTLQITRNNFVVHNNLGSAFMQQGRIIEAIDHFHEALRIKPDLAILRSNLKKALAAKTRGRIDIASVSRMLESEPKNPELYYRLGDLYKKKGDFAQAIAQYRNALSLRPDFVPALKNLAITFAMLGNYEKALSLFHKVIGILPDDADVYYKIACIYARQKKTEEAVKWLKESIKKGFSDKNLLRSDANLDNIRGSRYFRELIKAF